jgi:hypothetical protein
MFMLKTSRKLIAMAGLAAGTAIAGLTGAAQAQEIVLYDQPNFGGQSVVAQSSIGSLVPMRFNDRASSVRVVSGTWQLCEHENFRGQCITVDNDDINLGGFSDQITSLRPVAGGQDTGGQRGGRGQRGLTFYSGPNFTGRSVTLNDDQSDFSRISFNDTAQSVRYNGRRTWRVCQHSNYRGACLEISEDMPVIPGGLNRQISSASRDQGSGRRGGPRPQTGVWLYDAPAYGAQRIDITSDVTNLERQRFNDRAESLTIADGEVWEFCEHSNYRGRCETVEGGSVEDLRNLGLGNLITSMRRVDIYGSPGGGYPGPGGSGPISGGTQGYNSTFFARPRVNGSPVDRCLSRSRRNCDAQAAREICRSVGHSNAAYFAINRSPRNRTWLFGDNRQNTSSRGESLVDLLCID